MSNNQRDETSNTGHMAVRLDDVDREIARLLRADGRMSMRTLAERVHISRANAYTRLQRLRDEGVITGFHAAVHPERFGFAVSAYIAVKLRQQSWHGFTEALADVPGVEQAAMIAGEYDAVLLVRATDAQMMRDVVLEQLQAMPEVLGTQTMFVLDERPPG